MDCQSEDDESVSPSTPSWDRSTLSGEVREYSKAPSAFPQNLSLACERGSACHRALFCCLNAADRWYDSEQQEIEVEADDGQTYDFTVPELRKCCSRTASGGVQLKPDFDAASACGVACRWDSSQAMPHAFWWHHDGRPAVRYAALRNTLAQSLHMLLQTTFMLKSPPIRLDGDLLTATLRHKCCAWGFRHERIRGADHDVVELQRNDLASDGTPFEFAQGTHFARMPMARCPAPRKRY